MDILATVAVQKLTKALTPEKKIPVIRNASSGFLPHHGTSMSSCQDPKYASPSECASKEALLEVNANDTTPFGALLTAPTKFKPYPDIRTKAQTQRDWRLGSNAESLSICTPTTNLELLTDVAMSVDNQQPVKEKKCLFRQNGKKLFNSSVDSDQNSNRVGVSEELDRLIVQVNANVDKGDRYIGNSHNSSKRTFSQRSSFSSENYVNTNKRVILSENQNLLSQQNAHSVRKPKISTKASSEASRRDKSLELLCERFLELFPLDPLNSPRKLVLDEVANQLHTERRRIYDIVNVLESLNMACKVGKNVYEWHGRSHLLDTLARLKAMGNKLNLPKLMQDCMTSQSSFTFPQVQSSPDSTNGYDRRREKSLGIICQKLLMLLLAIPPPNVITMELAVQIIVADGSCSTTPVRKNCENSVPGVATSNTSTHRARGRRMYDISNVLSALGIVSKLSSSRSMQYTGPIDLPQVEPIIGDYFASFQRQSLLRHRTSSSSVTNITSLQSESHFCAEPTKCFKEVQVASKAPTVLANTVPTGVPTPRKRSYTESDSGSNRLYRMRSDSDINTKKSCLLEVAEQELLRIQAEERENRLQYLVSPVYTRELHQRVLGSQRGYQGTLCSSSLPVSNYTTSMISPGAPSPHIIIPSNVQMVGKKSVTSLVASRPADARKLPIAQNNTSVFMVPQSPAPKRSPLYLNKPINCYAGAPSTRNELKLIKRVVSRPSNLTSTLSNVKASQQTNPRIHYKVISVSNKPVTLFQRNGNPRKALNFNEPEGGDLK